MVARVHANEPPKEIHKTAINHLQIRYEKERELKIAFLGSGRVASALGSRWANNGHKVVYGVRDPGTDNVSEVVAKSGANASATTVDRSVIDSEVVVLGIPWNVTREVIGQLGSLEGKILIDCVNPIKSDFSGLELGDAPSAAEEIAGWAPGAKVVKAFNTVSDATMANGMYGDQQASMFYCGDDDDAKRIAAGLCAELDMEPIDAGPLQNARYLESMSMLYIHLAIFGGWGGNCAFKMLKREK